MSIFTKSLAVLLFAQASFAANSTGFSAKVFDKDSNKEKLLFTYSQQAEVKGDQRTLTNTFIDASDGAVAAMETVDFVKKGDEEIFLSYKVDQKQIGAQGSVEVKDGKAHFSFTKDGKTKTATEKAESNFVVGSSALPYLRKHWDDISKGKTVKVRLGVVDRLETVGFEFFRDREVEMNGRKVYVLKMKPSSFIIAALVNPLYWYVTADGEKLLEIHGRSQVRQKVGKDWKDLDAVTVYEYGSAAGNSK